MKLKSLLAATLIMGAAASFSQTYLNPVITGFHPDPSVCRVGDDFYLVNSTFQYFPGVPIFHSRDLVHWEQIGNVLSTPTQLELPTCTASSGIYAPTIRYHEGKYYMITTNIQRLYLGKAGNLIVTATDPAGPWSEPIYSMGVMGIDPSLFWDDDGRCYCSYSAFSPAGINLCEIDTETGEVLGENRCIWQGTGDTSPEGPHIYKKDGYYYLLIAEGGTGMGHKVTIARSRSIWGPYDSNPANPILTQKSLQAQGSLIQGAGHPDMVQAADGSWWMVCLAFRTTAGKELHTLGRETCLAPVRWDKGAWPVVNATGMIDVKMKTPTLPVFPFERPAVRTRFEDGSPLGFEWVYVANPKTENYTITRNRLQLTATAITLDDPMHSPTAVFRRQEDVVATVTTELSLLQSAEGDAAGFTVYMDPHGHYDLLLRGNADGTQSLQLRYRLGDMLHIEKEVVLPEAGQKVQLRLEADAKHYAFSYSLDGKSFHPLGKMNTFFLATETLGGFTGMMFGLFAEGQEATQAKAVFSWFDYEGKDRHI